MKTLWAQDLSPEEARTPCYIPCTQTCPHHSPHAWHEPGNMNHELQDYHGGVHGYHQLVVHRLTMISSGVYWLTSNLSFSSLTPAPSSSAIKGDFKPCNMKGLATVTQAILIGHLKPSRVAAHSSSHSGYQVSIRICFSRKYSSWLFLLQENNQYFKYQCQKKMKDCTSLQ